MFDIENGYDQFIGFRYLNSFALRHSMKKHLFSTLSFRVYLITVHVNDSNYMYIDEKGDVVGVCDREDSHDYYVVLESK